MTDRIVAIGGHGQLGTALAARGVRVLGRTEADVTDPGTLASALAGASAVVNCAAYVNVDAAEGDGAADAWAVNAQGPANVARACALVGARLVHVSTRKFSCSR